VVKNWLAYTGLELLLQHRKEVKRILFSNTRMSYSTKRRNINANSCDLDLEDSCVDGFAICCGSTEK
jgi:hypothetical protein